MKLTPKPNTFLRFKYETSILLLWLSFFLMACTKKNPQILGIKCDQIETVKKTERHSDIFFVINKAGAPVYEQPNETAKVLSKAPFGTRVEIAIANSAASDTKTGLVWLAGVIYLNQNRTCGYIPYASVTKAQAELLKISGLNCEKRFDCRIERACLKGHQDSCNQVALRENSCGENLAYHCDYHPNDR